MNVIGAKIKAARKDANLTQEQLAEKSGIIPTTIRKYELGTQTPKFENLKKIVVALDINPIEIFGAEWFDLQIGKEKVGQLASSSNLLKAIKNQHGQLACNAFGKFVELNSIGQEKALDYIEDLYEQTKYKK